MLARYARNQQFLHCHNGGLSSHKNLMQDKLDVDCFCFICLFFCVYCVKYAIDLCILYISGLS